MDSLIKEFSARFSQFKELSETFKFIMYPDVISFDKRNLSQFDWLKIEELEMQLIGFQSSSIWIQKFIETRKKLELIEVERLTSNISKNTSNKFWKHTWNSIPDVFNCLKKLAYAILTIFSSTYACESLFSEINNIKDSLRNCLTDDSNSAGILLKVTSYNSDISYLSSNLQQQKSY
ncbi:dimer_Tnp_hAT domain-containing protein [Trichonephila clavipes]|nr:dimer_Tnp_hAT domain-containing protein [Trichonephila clavipes]